MKLILPYLKKYKFYAFMAPMLMLVEVVCEIMLPKMMTKILNTGVTLQDVSFIGSMGGAMLVLMIIGIIGGIGSLIMASNASQRLGTDIRQDAFEKIQAFSFTNIDTFQTSSLITRLTNDITQIQLVVLMSLRMLVRAPLLIVGSLAMAASINGRLSLILLTAIPVLLLLVCLIMKKAFPRFNSVQERLDQINLVMRETLSGVRVIKAFVRGNYELEKFQKINKEYKNTSLSAFRVVILTMPGMMLVVNCSIIAILWFGAMQIQGNALGLGDIMAFITYLMQMLMSLMMLAMVFMNLSRAKVSLDRVSLILDTIPDIHSPENPITAAVNNGLVEYKDVSFWYGDGEEDPVLSHVSFTAKAGETVAIIGETGSGKSTLIQLMSRLYDASAGEVCINGVDVRFYDLKTLRKKVAVVLQETILFSGTIRDNLKWGKSDATEEEMFSAAKAAQAHDFIITLPKQYDTILGQKGVNLSGGQKQRLSIARALLQSPEIIIFDDSTSAVDMATERRLQNALRENHKHCTKFIIAGRISSIQHADKILLLDGGKIAGEGNHNNLMLTSPLYRDIYETQMGKGAVFHE